MNVLRLLVTVAVVINIVDITIVIAHELQTLADDKNGKGQLVRRKEMIMKPAKH